MNDNDINNLINRLHDFDADDLQREMTDGLEQWCQCRVGYARFAKRALASLLLLVTLSAVAMTTVPDLRHAVFHSKGTPVSEPVSPTPPSAQREKEIKPLEVDSAVALSVLPIDHVELAEGPKMAAMEPLPRWDFVVQLSSGDSLFCKVLMVAKSVSVSVQGSSAHPEGALVLPASVEHDGLRYSVTALADSALADCRELRSVTLPPTLTTIGLDAFCGCSRLDSLIALPETPPKIIGEWCFWEVPQEAVLAVPCRSGTAYRIAHCWDWFDTIVDTCEAPLLPISSHATIKFNGNYLIVEGVYGEVVRVYDFEGRLITSELCNGQCRISIGNGMSFHHTSAFLVQVGDSPAIKVSAPLRNSAPVGGSYHYWGNGF